VVVGIVGKRQKSGSASKVGAGGEGATLSVAEIENTKNGKWGDGGGEAETRSTL